MSMLKWDNFYDKICHYNTYTFNNTVSHYYGKTLTYNIKMT